MAESEASGEESPAGHLFQFNTAGQVRDVANVGNFDYAWSAETRTWRRRLPDSNPLVCSPCRAACTWLTPARTR